MAGAFAGGYLTMQYAVPTLEAPAFYLRPHPDLSCFAMEAAGLRALRPLVGLASLSGSIFSPGSPGAAFLSLALDLTPGVGTLKGLIQAITGKDLITGAHLNWGERLLGLLPFAHGALLAGRETLGLLRVLSGGDLEILASAIRDSENLQPLERSITDIANQVRQTPALQDLMAKLQSAGYSDLPVWQRYGRLGDVFELRAALQEMMSEGRGIRQIQNIVPDKNGILRNGADLITKAGDLIQLKNYGGKSWYSNLSGAILRQADSDFLRYGLNGWRSATSCLLKSLAIVTGEAVVVDMSSSSRLYLPESAFQPVVFSAFSFGGFTQI